MTQKHNIIIIQLHKLNWHTCMLKRLWKNDMFLYRRRNINGLKCSLTWQHYSDIVNNTQQWDFIFSKLVTVLPSTWCVHVECVNTYTHTLTLKMMWHSESHSDSKDINWACTDIFMHAHNLLQCTCMFRSFVCFQYSTWW